MMELVITSVLWPRNGGSGGRPGKRRRRGRRPIPSTGCARSAWRCRTPARRWRGASPRGGCGGGSSPSWTTIITARTISRCGCPRRWASRRRWGRGIPRGSSGRPTWGSGAGWGGGPTDVGAGSRWRRWWSRRIGTWRRRPKGDAVADSSVKARDVDAVIVGAGFAGLYMLHRLRGLGFSARVFERGKGVGGTWYWNRYPGARCDVESMDYSFSFSPELEQDWEWTERYASQPEILKYANHVADRFDLKRDIQFETQVVSAVFDEAARLWPVRTDGGDEGPAPFWSIATGCLSDLQVPPFKGVETFKGKRYRAGSWPHEGVEFTGRRVAIVGTGSSAIQSIPLIAKQAAHLYVF